MRTSFAVVFVLVQVLLIVTAELRPDRAFGFRMFQESSTLHVELVRDVEAPSGHGTVRVPVRDGAWSARGPDGEQRRHDWRARVREPGLSTFGVWLHASYGADAQLARLRAALDDVATHVAEDTETRRLGLEIRVRRNGGPEETIFMVRALP